MHIWMLFSLRVSCSVSSQCYTSLHIRWVAAQIELKMMALCYPETYAHTTLVHVWHLPAMYTGLHLKYLHPLKPEHGTSLPYVRYESDTSVIRKRKGDKCTQSQKINLLKPTGYVMHHQFNIQQLYAHLTLYLCVLYLSENKQRLVPLTA
jgi:hypothetical protein